VQVGERASSQDGPAARPDGSAGLQNAAVDDKNIATRVASPAPGKSALSMYKLGKTLGTGGFATVKLATHKETGEQYAAKIMQFPPESGDPKDNVKREEILKEIDILQGLKHANIMLLVDHFIEEDKVYLLTELLNGGELLDAVLDKGTYSERDARKCFINLLHGVEYLHEMDVVHRDLKLENLILSSRNDFTTIKIVDFGLAKKSNSTRADTICGTPQYVAPEVLHAGAGEMSLNSVYNSAVDMWSVGIVLFILLGGYPPFYDEVDAELFEKIKRAKVYFDDPCWDDVSAGAKDLICKLLYADPDVRLTAKQALAHPWVLGDESLVGDTHLVRTHDKLKENYGKKFKGAIFAVRGAIRLKALSQPGFEGLLKGGNNEALEGVVAQRNSVASTQDNPSVDSPHCDSPWATPSVKNGARAFSDD